MESTLFRVVDILNIHKISYWVTDGTLLGIVREDRILPWDSDIDIAVWKSEVSKINIIKIFEDEGFEHIEVLPNMDCLNFQFNNIQVDISFYTKNNKEASIKWATVPRKKIDRFTIFLIKSIFQHDNKSLDINYKKYFFKSVIMDISGLLGKLLSRKLKIKMFNYARSKYIYIGSFYPIHLLVFKKIKFKELELEIPKDSNEYLRLCYGDNWRTPNKKFIWENDTYNLKEFL